MRAKKKHQINFERKEKMIHKETMRFFSLLEMHSSSTINNQPYFPELYENVVNHIRDYLSNTDFNDEQLRTYLNDETHKIKNFFIDEIDTKNDDQNLTDIKSTSLESEEYTQTIFDITTRSHINDCIVNDTTTIDDDISYNSDNTNQLKKLRNEKFPNLQVLSVNQDDVNNFVSLSEEPFFDKIFNQQKSTKFSFIRFLKYRYFKIKRKINK